MTFEENVREYLHTRSIEPTSASAHDLMCALMSALCSEQDAAGATRGGRKLYYFSAEFLIGRLLRANLINLDLLDRAQDLLQSWGTSLSEVEDAEPEPSLGNGGLGRLAACFMDSIASLGLNGCGVGLNYHYGLFRQNLSEGYQQEEPNPWIEDTSWLRDEHTTFTVPFACGDVVAKLYDIELPGYHNGVVNRLHLFDVENPAPAPTSGISFDKNDIQHCLTSFLYPDDSDEAGRLLRVYQEYFMVCAGAQLIIADAQQAGWQLDRLDDHIAVHINDTHPSMIIPELVRQLTLHGVSQDRACEIVENACAYTNHTILSEALETWNMSSIERVAPQLVDVITNLDERAKARTSDPALAIIDRDNRVHMAHMDVHFSRSVNGVAKLHTDILKNSEMNGFYNIYPDKFNNKTNGITFRRWLMGCNPMLAAAISDAIGESWKDDASHLIDLLKHIDDAAFRQKLDSIKAQNKHRLADWLQKTQGITLNRDAIFDVQIKRLHQYKRQQLNAMYAMWKYLDIKKGHIPARPLVMIFAAKAAPAYTLAKDIIHMLLCLSKLIEQDEQVRPYLQLVMVENYNVTAAEHLIPAANISEQISLASKEASGTGNMKMMANGALTLGTMDGANVEIVNLVGKDNAYIFGKTSQEVIDAYKNESYHPWDYWKSDAMIRELIDFIISPSMLALGSSESLGRVYQDLLSHDWFMTLPDVADYISTKERCLADFENRDAWITKTIINIAHSGYFSSDRTISEYNRDIWHLDATTHEA